VLVEGGAQVGARNGSGVSPLAMALIVGNLDAAEALVARGARLAKEDGPMVSGVTDPRGRALIARASR
jgi:ankyrin repeat protein